MRQKIPLLSQSSPFPGKVPERLSINLVAGRNGVSSSAGRYQIDTQCRPENQESGQLQYTFQHLLPFKMFAYRQRGKNNHHHYRHQIFDDKNPQDMPVNFCWRSPMSLKALNTMAVDDMDNIPPRKILLMWENPIAFPAV